MTAASNPQKRDPTARSVTFRLPIELYREINGQAIEESRSMNSLVCMLMREALEARDQKGSAERAEFLALKKQLREAKKAAAAAIAAAAV